MLLIIFLQFIVKILKHNEVGLNISGFHTTAEGYFFLPPST